jgi:hypothetical protein
VTTLAFRESSNVENEAATIVPRIGILTKGRPISEFFCRDFSKLAVPVG